MVDVVLVDRATGTTLDPNTLAEVPTYSSVYVGPGRVQRGGGMAANDTVAGGSEYAVTAPIVQLPIAATGVLPGDRVTVTAVADTTDPDLLGLVATVRANLTKTHATKRTLVCEEVS